MELHPFHEKPRVVILVSKEAHCLNDLLHRTRHANFPIQVVGIASNHNDLKEMADWYKIPFHYWPVTAETKQRQEEQIATLIENERAELVILARYMQIISPELSKRSPREGDQHPPFLPAELQGSQALPSSVRAGSQADWSDCPLRQR